MTPNRFLKIRERLFDLFRFQACDFHGFLCLPVAFALKQFNDFDRLAEEHRHQALKHLKVSLVAQDVQNDHKVFRYAWLGRLVPQLAIPCFTEDFAA